MIVAGAVLALVLVRSGAVRREASPFGQAPAPRGLDSRRTQYLGGIEPPARQSHPGPRPPPALTPRLAPPGAAVLVDRTRPERVYPVQGTTSVGRSRHNEIVLEDLTVSRQHAWLRLEGGECWLQDAGSTNGTYINGRLVHQPRRLRHGDVVRFGQVELVFAQEG